MCNTAQRNRRKLASLTFSSSRCYFSSYVCSACIYCFVKGWHFANWLFPRLFRFGLTGYELVSCVRSLWNSNHRRIVRPKSFQNAINIDRTITIQIHSITQQMHYNWTLYYSRNMFSRARDVLLHSHFHIFTTCFCYPLSSAILVG